MFRSVRTIAVAVLAALALLVSACGGDDAMPKDEFVDKFIALATDGMADAEVEAMSDSITEFAECIYDAIEDDAELVNSIDDVESSDEQLPAEIEARTADCQADAEANITEDLGVDALDG